MSRGAPGVRHMSGELKACVERGFRQVSGRRMTDYDFSIMTLSQARQYADVDQHGTALPSENIQAVSPARPARPRMDFASHAHQTLTLEPQPEPRRQIDPTATITAIAGRFSFMKRKLVIVPSAIVLVVGLGGGVMAMSHDAGSEAASRTAKPGVSPVSDQSQNQATQQQAETPAAAPATTPAAGIDAGAAGNPTKKQNATTSPAPNLTRQSTPPATPGNVSPPALLPDSPTPAVVTDPMATPPPAPTPPPVTDPQPSPSPPPTPPADPTPPVELPTPTPV